MSKCAKEVSKSFLKFHLLLEQKEEITETQLESLVDSDSHVMAGSSDASTSTKRKSGDVDDATTESHKASSPQKKTRRMNPYGVKKPHTAYIVFCQEYRNKKNSVSGGEETSGEDHSTNSKDFVKEMGQKWSQMTEAERAPFVAQALKLKAEYDLKIREFKHADGNAKADQVNPSASESHDEPVVSADMHQDEMDADFDCGKKKGPSSSVVATPVKAVQNDENAIPSIVSNVAPPAATSNMSSSATPEISSEDKEKRRQEKWAKKQKKLKKEALLKAQLNPTQQ